MYIHEYFSAERHRVILGVPVGVRYRIDIAHIGESDGLSAVTQRFDCDGATRIIRVGFVVNGDSVFARIVFRNAATNQRSY